MPGDTPKLNLWKFDKKGAKLVRTSLKKGKASELRRIITAGRTYNQAVQDGRNSKHVRRAL